MISVILLCAAAAARGEIVRLNDGSSIEGIVKRVSDGYDVTDPKGKVTHIAAENVKRIEIGAKVSGVVEAESRLGSLRRSVENATDIKAILERYARFIEQNKDSPIAKEAQHDEAIWRERLEKGMVKVGPRWVSMTEREQIKASGVVVAAQARELLRQGRMKDADPLLQQAVEDDPGNVSAAYLRGLVLFKQDQVQPARKSFEAVAALLKDHAPTLNNLAVVLWRQNQQMGAMNFYLQAMLAAPLRKEILNNVAEALNALPQNQRSATVAQKVFRAFTEQDALLAAQMAQVGLYRWGSTWVDKAQMEKLLAIEKEIQKKLDAMSDEYDDTKKKVVRIDGDIDDNVRLMKSMEETSYARDPQGNIYRVPLPRRYYDLGRENRQLAADRAELIAKLDGLRAAAKQVQQQLPTPRFTSVQRLIELEGTPGLPAMKLAGPVGAEMLPATPVSIPTTLPATMPATRPATQPAQRQAVPDSLLAPG